MTTTTAPTTARPDLKVGAKVKLAPGPRSDAVRWWTVRAADDRFVILTRQRDFAPKGSVLYTIIDWERGERGPCDLVFGPPWNLNVADGAEQLLAALNRHADGDHTSGISTQVSHRSSLPATVVEVR